jgi:hypothetical protein
MPHDLQMADGIVWDPPTELIAAAAQLRRLVWPDFTGHDPTLLPRSMMVTSSW